MTERKQGPTRKAAPGPEASALDFEAAMERLEQIVTDLEEGELGLDQSIRSFEEGMELVRRCAHELKRAESQVKKLTAEASRILEEDFEIPGNSALETPNER